MARKLSVIKAKLPVLILKEGDMFVAWSPALDLCTCASTFDEARENLVEALDLFFEECLKRDTLDQALESYGWQKVKTEWHPPVVVAHESLAVEVPSAA